MSTHQLSLRTRSMQRHVGLSRLALRFSALRFAAMGLGALVLSTVGCSKRDEDAASPTDVLPPGAENAPVRVGAPAPDFDAVAHSGQHVRLSDLRGKVVILYFYPKDGTPGCTKEATGFRDEYQVLDEAGAVVIGVSTQDNESHREFAERYNLPFLLLPDEDASIAKAYGVGSVLGFTKRVTFIIDRQGRIAQVYEKVSPPGHAQEILQDIRHLPPADAPASEPDSQDGATEPPSDAPASPQSEGSEAAPQSGQNPTGAGAQAKAESR